MTDESDSRGRRCICGHWLSEHTLPQTYAPDGRIRRSAGACAGAYATLAADADDRESVEVGCQCRRYYEAEQDFEIR